MIVYLDLDEVIVNTYSSICEFKNLQNPYLKEENKGSYSISEMLNINHEDFWNTITRDQWANMTKFKWSDLLVGTLADLDHLGICTFRFLTSPITTGDCYAGKFDWIERNYPKLANKLIIGKYKQDIVGHRDLLIDDSPVNLKYFKKAGKESSMFFFPSIGNSRWRELPKTEQEQKDLIQKIVLTIMHKSGT